MMTKVNEEKTEASWKRFLGTTMKAVTHLIGLASVPLVYVASQELRPPIHELFQDVVVGNTVSFITSFIAYLIAMTAVAVICKYTLWSLGDYLTTEKSNGRFPEHRHSSCH